MSKDAPLSNVTVLVILTLVTGVAWTLLTGQYWFWIPIVAALMVTAAIRRRLS